MTAPLTPRQTEAIAAYVERYRQWLLENASITQLIAAERAALALELTMDQLDTALDTVRTRRPRREPAP